MILFQKSDLVKNRFTVSNQTQLKNWLKEIAARHNQTIKSINYFFCSDDEILEANNTYLQHDYYTDIITFELTEVKNKIEGDILISVDTVDSNAKLNKVDFDIEMARVVSHGLLHLLGFNDKENKEKVQMRKEEDWAINQLFHVKHNKKCFNLKSST